MGFVFRRPGVVERGGERLALVVENGNRVIGRLFCHPVVEGLVTPVGGRVLGVGLEGGGRVLGEGGRVEVAAWVGGGSAFSGRGLGPS